MEGCGIPPKRAGQHRQEMSNYTCHRIPHSGFPLWQRKKKKTTEQILPPPIIEKESQSSNVKAADRYIEKKKKSRLRSCLLPCIIYTKDSPIYLN